MTDTEILELELELELEIKSLFKKHDDGILWLDGDKYVFSYEKDRDENYYKEFEADNIRDLIRKAKEPQDGS